MALVLLVGYSASPSIDTCGRRLSSNFGSYQTLLPGRVIEGLPGMAFGLFFSAFAKNEFQAVQFMLAFVLP